MAAASALDRLCVAADGSEKEKEALALLAKIFGNILDNPGEPKFRRLNIGSARLQATLLRLDGAREFLAVAGFVSVEGTAESGILELPSSADSALAAAHAAVTIRQDRLRLAALAPPQGLDASGAVSYQSVVHGGVQGRGLAELESLAESPEGREALQLLEGILVNIRRYPTTDKYRCVNLSKPRGRKVAPAVPLLEAAGFEEQLSPEGETCMQLGRPSIDVLERVWAMVWWATQPACPVQARLLSSCAAGDRMDHALGLVLGLAIGDALGAPLGGRGPFEVAAAEIDKAMEMCGGGLWSVAPGQVTGNIDLAVCLASSLAEAKDSMSVFPADAIALNYGNWGKSLPFRAERACTQAFQRPLPAAEMMQRARDSNPKAMGSGALARCAPLAALAALQGKPKSVVDLARADALLSHPSAVVGNACAAYCLASGCLVVTGGDRSAARAELMGWVDRENVAAGQGKPGASLVEDSRFAQLRAAAEPGEEAWVPPGEKRVAMEELVGWLNRALASDDELPFSDAAASSLLSGESGSVSIPIMHAFRHLKLGSTFEGAMRAVLAGGGDCNTNAAVVGGLIGASVGYSRLPRRWVKAVLACDTGAGHFRPPEYHPKNFPDCLTRMASTRRR